MSGPDYIDGPCWSHRKRDIVLMAGKREYRGKLFFELREWRDGADGLTATGRGSTMPLEAVESLHDALGAWLAANRPPPAMRVVK